MKTAGDEVAKGIANADPLKVWVTDGAVFFPSCALWTWHGQNSGEDYGATIEKTAERAGTIVDVAVQIVKFTEEGPVFLARYTLNVDSNWGSLKTVSGKPSGRRIKNPVGLEPIKDVIVARDCHKLLISLADCLGNSSRADLSHCAIND